MSVRIWRLLYTCELFGQTQATEFLFHASESAFALQKRNMVLSPRLSARNAALERFPRPKADISQSAAPFIIESGTGSEVRQPLRYAIVGGLPVSQILSLYTTPVIYLTLDRLRRRAAAVMYVPSKLKSSASVAIQSLFCSFVWTDSMKAESIFFHSGNALGRRREGHR
jgi:hypothetical protein